MPSSYLLALINTDGSNPVGGDCAPEPGQCLSRRGARRAGAQRPRRRRHLAERSAHHRIPRRRAHHRDCRCFGGAREGRAAQRAVGENRCSASNTSRRNFRHPTRNRGITGWVELEFTVLADGSTGDIVVTNSNPRRTFDTAAMTAVGQWRYKPVIRATASPSSSAPRFASGSRTNRWTATHTHAS